MKRIVATFVCATSLASCAHYQPEPLPTALEALTPPDTAVLSVEAQKIDRPFLRPQPLDLSEPLTPNALAVIAVLENKDLKALRAKNGVTDAQAFAARLLPDPTVGANYDKLISGEDPMDAFGAQLGFDLNQLRTARVTREASEATARQVRLDLAWAEWNTAGQARLDGLRVQALSAQREIAEANLASAQRLFAASERASGRGDVSASELDTARLALINASTTARALEGDLAKARSDLVSQLGFPPETVIHLASPSPPPAPPDASILFAQAAERRLDLQALRAGYAASEADFHKAVLEQFPNLSLTLAGARDTANNWTLGPAIGFTLPLWNRNRGNIAIAKATRNQLKAEYEARLHQTRAEIDAGVAGLMMLRHQRDALAVQLPEIARHAHATQRAAKRGDLAPSTAEASLQALRDQKLTLMQLDQQIAEQTIALELLSGGPSEGWTK